MLFLLISVTIQEMISKKVRLSQLEYLLLQQTKGIKRAEIARRLGVHRATISRDIDLLSASLPIIEDEEGHLRIDKRGYLTNVSLTMFELEALHLSARLFSKVMKFPFPHAAGALRKLAEAQGKVSSTLADRIRDSAEEIELSTSCFPKTHGRYRGVIEKLGLAISEMRPVTLVHFSSRKGEDQSFTLLPVTLEPHPEGKAVHLVGWEHLSKKPFFRTLKVERINSIEMYDPSPAIFAEIPLEKIKSLFADAWSIWTKSGDPEEVVLRFFPAVAARVAETQWHASQKLTENPDGTLIWWGTIAEPREMYPWIRGWGPDVEVLCPEWLRQQHREDFQRGRDLYGEKKGDF